MSVNGQPIGMMRGESVSIEMPEGTYNILFDIDLVIWMASFFFTLPSPWNIVYHALSDGFFALWIARLIIIRDRYYKLK